MMTCVHCKDHNIDHPASDICPKCNEIVGKFVGKDVRFWQLKMYPEILKDPRYLNLATLEVRFETIIHLDWKCKYCGSLNPSNLYKCDICGASK